MIRTPIHVPADLSGLVGQRLLNVTKQDWSWFFTFSDGGMIVTESDWRLITGKGIAVASEDHGHLFGLKEPVDAAARVLTVAKERKVLSVTVADRTSDLTLAFPEEVSLEFLNLSCGYESWRAILGTIEVICIGGGGLSVCHTSKG